MVIRIIKCGIFFQKKIVRTWVIITIFSELKFINPERSYSVFWFSSNHTIHAYVKEDFVIWWHEHFFFGICKHISVNIKIHILTDICEFNIDRYMNFFQKYDRYMPKFFIFWSIYENFQKPISSNQNQEKFENCMVCGS